MSYEKRHSGTKTSYLILICVAIAFFFFASMLTLSQELLNQKAISFDMARSIVQTAIEKCRADGYHVSATVLDNGGRTQASGRDDGAGLNTLDVSRQKAYTAFMFRRSSGEIAKAWAANPPAFKVDGTIGLPGGLPIKFGSDVIGAVGVAGAPGGDKDEACASAGIARFSEKLK